VPHLGGRANFILKGLKPSKLQDIVSTLENAAWKPRSPTRRGYARRGIHGAHSHADMPTVESPERITTPEFAQFESTEHISERFCPSWNPRSLFPRGFASRGTHGAYNDVAKPAVWFADFNRVGATGRIIRLDKGKTKIYGRNHEPG
jgi:hypothetical protein